MQQASPRIIKTKDYKEFSKKAASLIAGFVNLNPEAVLGLATGSTPEGTYSELINIYKKGEVDFSRISTINLDEYVGLSSEHEQSYRYFMDTKLFDHININKANTYLPDGMAKNIEQECEDYEKTIKKLGYIDFQVLGIGTNGHIGFNEPCEYFSKKTVHTPLAISTIEANSRFFDSYEDVPKTAISMGIATIFKAKQILLLASGENKKQIMKEAFLDEITPQIPASILQLHPNVTIIVDEEAGEYL